MKIYKYNQYQLFRLPKEKPIGNSALVRDDNDILEWKLLDELSQEVNTFPWVDFLQEYNNH